MRGTLKVGSGSEVETVAGREFLKRQARDAAALGHFLEVEQYGQGGVKFRAVCSCGYSSTQRRSQGMALGAGFHHLGQVAGQAQRDGRSLPSAAPGDTPKIAEVPRTVGA